LFAWEAKFLTLLEFKMSVKASLFAKYVTELRQVFAELVGIDAAMTKRFLSILY